jgi:sugar phosphate permease
MNEKPTYPHPQRYRWAVLAAGTTAQASFAAITLGLPVLAPVVRTDFHLSLREIGLVLSAPWIGATITFLAWGLAVDRYGERATIAVGLTGSAMCLIAAARVSRLEPLLVLLVLSGAFGASVHSASGRAVMRWFDPDERGFALGIRQTAIPLGGVTVSLVVPSLAESGGTGAAFLFFACTPRSPSSGSASCFSMINTGSRAAKRHSSSPQHRCSLPCCASPQDAGPTAPVRGSFLCGGSG